MPALLERDVSEERTALPRAAMHSSTARQTGRYHTTNVTAMVGDEARVTGAFADWLRHEGWTVKLEVGHVDVVATCCDSQLYAEVKGRTKAAGLDVDTAYGQLVRRMTKPSARVRYAIVVQTGAVFAALRVQPEIRSLLNIDAYEVTDDGVVRRH